MNRKFLLFIFLSILVVIIVGCTSNNSLDEEGLTDTVRSITVQELKSELANGIGDNTVIVDVREPNLYEKEHVSGAILIPFADFRQQYNQLDKDKKVIIVCHMGPMGEAAGQFLLTEGYKQVYNLEGGMRAWRGK